MCLNFAGTRSRILLPPLSSSRRVILSWKIALNSNGEVNCRELAWRPCFLSINCRPVARVVKIRTFCPPWKALATPLITCFFLSTSINILDKVDKVSIWSRTMILYYQICINFIPLWKGMWCHCIFYVRPDWNVHNVVRENMIHKWLQRSVVEMLMQMLWHRDMLWHHIHSQNTQSLEIAIILLAIIQMLYYQLVCIAGWKLQGGPKNCGVHQIGRVDYLAN